MKILFVAHRYPLPMLSGDRVRTYHHIKTLSESHDVFLLCPPPKTKEADEALSGYLAGKAYVKPNPVRTCFRLASGTIHRTPFQTLAHSDGLYRRLAATFIREHAIDVAHVQLVRMAPVLEGAPIPRLLDLMDALSLNMKQLAAHSKGPKKLVATIESRRLVHYEQAMLRDYHAGGITAARDRHAMGDPENLFVVQQGVPSHGGAPETQERPVARIVFAGRMSYFPNVDAVCWFATAILPLIRAQIPHAEFVIAGAMPTPRVTALNDLPGVKVLGFVESVTAELIGSTVAVAPMRCGTGMQTKVLEAIAVGTPLVVTPVGLGNIDLRSGEHVSVAEEADSFARAVVHLLTNRDEAVEQARRGRLEVEKNYSWDASVRQLLEAYRYAQDVFHHRGTSELPLKPADGNLAVRR